MSYGWNWRGKLSYLNGDWDENSRGYMTEQKQISKQEVTMQQDQALSNDIFARLLSVAENYAMRSKKNNKSNQKYHEQFGYYDTFNSGKTKNLKELKSQFLFEIEIFKYSYQDFCKNYNNYQYPNNYDKNKAISFLNNLSQMVEECDKKYYDSIIQILIKGNSNSYENEIREMEKNKANKGKADPKLLMKAYPMIQSVGENIKKNVEENVLKNGKHEVNFVIGGKNNDDKKMKKITEKINENTKKNENENSKKKEDKKTKENETNGKKETKEKKEIAKIELKEKINGVCYIYNNNNNIEDANKININVYNNNRFDGIISNIKVDISNMKKINLEINTNRKKMIINGIVNNLIIKGTLNLFNNSKIKNIEINCDIINYSYNHYYNKYLYNYSFKGMFDDSFEENYL